MKNSNVKTWMISICALFAMSSVLLGCGGDEKKEETKPPVVNEISETTEIYVESEPAVIRPMVFVVALNENVSFYVEKNEGEMEPTSMTVPNGTMLAAYMDSKKEALRVLSSGKEMREFIQVLFEGEEYWVQTSIVAINARPALIVEDGLLYSKPTADGTYTPSIKLSFGQIVAVHMTSDDEILEDSGIKFVKVSLKYNDTYYMEKYVKASFVNDDEATVTVMRMLKNIDKSKSKIARQEMVDAALNICEIRELPYAIKQLVIAKKSEVEAHVPDLTFEDRYYFDDVHVDAVPGDKEIFNVRDNPGVKANVVKKISSGQSYDLIMMTDKTDKVGDVEGHWYYVKVYSAADPSSVDCAGWVFGDEFNYYSDNIELQELAS